MITIFSDFINKMTQKIVATVNKSLRAIMLVTTFVGAFIGIYYISEGHPTQGLRLFMAIGVIPLSLLGTIRHIGLPGQIIKGQEFFEFEAGGANLAIGVAGILTLTQKMDNASLGLIFLVYAVYLLMSLIAWSIYNSKKTSIFVSFNFVGNCCPFDLFLLYWIYSQK